jgi:hypothetical protein
MALALVLTFSKNGIGSFVTLGIIGAAVYTVPAIVDAQVSLAMAGMSRHTGYVAVPPDVKFTVTMAWVGLNCGLLATLGLFPCIERRVGHSPTEDFVGSIALTSAILATVGFLYLALVSGGVLFFLETRTDQITDPVSLLWRWTALIGVVAATLAGRPKLLLYHCIILLIIFLRGDRTIVALSIASIIVTTSYKDPRWYAQLKPLQISALTFGVIAVFFGKSIYQTIKSGMAGQGWDPISLSTKAQLMSQFEPLGTFSHLEYVMRTGVTIGPWDFLESVLGNILIVPSAFGVSTNLYNAVVSATLSPRLGYGIAGNYLAHGYTVAGTLGAALFYFILPPMLRLCDGQFQAKDGSAKIFWCCVGAVIAFYIHRNGLDNEFSFVRQIFVVSVITATLAAALRHFGIAGQPQRSAIRPHRVGRVSDDGEFVLVPVETPPHSRPAQHEGWPPA